MKRYRIDNWREYNQALIKRGSLTIWVEETALAQWQAPKIAGKRGRPFFYSNEAILMLLMVREVYRLPLRALQGFASSIFLLMGLDLPVPSYTQISRRAQQLSRSLKRRLRGDITDIVFDSTGLKVFGEGEWKVRIHGKGKRRSWKKLHIGVDPRSQEIVFWEITEKEAGDAQVAERLLSEIDDCLGTVYGDGAYDSGALRAAVHERGGKTLIPPPQTATYKGATSGWERERDEVLALIAGLGDDELARKLWKKLSGYHLRSLGETAFSRLKTILGAHLKNRSPGGQASESYCKCLVLNKMTNLGIPRGEWIEVAA